MSAPAAPRADGSSFDRVIAALGDRVTRLDQGRRHADARCPAHDDQRPSLTVDWTHNPAKGGLTMAACHSAGCSFRDILAAIGLSMVDAFDNDRPGYSRPSPSLRARSKPAQTSKNTGTQTGPSRRRVALPPLEQEYPYAWPDGTVAGWFRRHQGKVFHWQKPHPSKPGERIGGQPRPCPLYREPGLAAAIAAGAEIHLVEGEKDADAVAAAGAVAVSVPNGVTVSQGGVPKNLTEEHIAALRGAHLVIWADRDGPDRKSPERGYQGYRHAMHVRDQLGGVVASWRVVEARAGKDSFDHLGAGNQLGDAVEIIPEHRVPAAILSRWGVPVPADHPDAGMDADVITGPWRGQPGSEDDGQADEDTRGGGGGGPGERKREIYVRDRYEIFGDALVKVEENSESIKRRELINAQVRITRQVARDLGEAHDVEKLVDLEITRDGETHTVTSLKWEEFENPTKWAPKVPLGLTFNRGHGRGTVVNAIIACSGVVPVVTAYGMLGWRQLADGRWVYLHAGGAIDAEGTLLGTRVEVSPRLRGFRLPDPPEGEQLRRSYDAMMALADELPHHIAYPLIAAGARAPLGDCSANLFCLGKPGTYKSGTAALVQQMWDTSARYNRLPAGAGEAMATGPALEQLVYEAGHSVMVLDDLAPDRGVARSAARGAEIIRMMGNRQGKARSTRDSTGLRGDKIPRALAILTGEDQPNVQSAERRTIYLKFARGDVSVAALKALSAPWMINARPGLTAALAQRAAARMPTAEWLEQQRDTYAEWLTQAWGDSDDGVVAGRCNNIAELMTGMHELLDLVVEAGVVTREEAAQRWSEACQAFRAVLATQFELVDRRSLSERAADLLRSALRSGRAHLKSRTGATPANAGRFGWVDTAFEARPGGAAVGWTDGDGWVLLEPGAAFAVIEAEGKAQSDPLDVTKRALRRDLLETGLLAVEPAKPGRTPRDVKETVGGERQRVWKLPYRWLYPDTEQDDDDGIPQSDPTAPPPAPPFPVGDPTSSTSKPAQTPKRTEDQTPVGAPTPSANKPAQTAAEAPNRATGHKASTDRRKRRTEPPRPLGGDGRGYKAAGVVVDVDGAFLIGGAGSAQPVPPEFQTVSDLMQWATGLYLGIRRAGGKAARDRGARDDAGLVVVMPRLARKLGVPTKAPDRDKPAATRNKIVKTLQADGWTVGERGLQPYTAVWPSKGGPETFLVFPQWIRDEPLFANLDSADMLAYRLALYIAQVGMQLIYTSRSTGAELLKQLRAYTDYPLTVHVQEVPPPGCNKDHAPIEDAEWHHWRAPTTLEQQEYQWVIALDVNAHYLPAAASAVVGHGRPEHHVDLEVPDDPRALRRLPAYWLLDEPTGAQLDPRLPNLWRPSSDDHRTGPRWVATPYLLALLEAGYPINRAREAWIYPHPGSHLQTWSHKLRDAIYDLDAHLLAVDDPDAEAVLKTLKLTYAGGIGHWGSERWKKGTALWLPHYRHSLIGLAMANQWRKIKATADATGRYPLGVYRDAVYYPATSADAEQLPYVDHGFQLQRKGHIPYTERRQHADPGDPYRVGKVKFAALANMTAYADATAVTDPKKRREALETIWTDVSGHRDERSE